MGSAGCSVKQVELQRGIYKALTCPLGHSIEGVRLRRSLSLDMKHRVPPVHQ